MTWTKLSDDFSDDCWELSDAADRLHVDGLTWSNRKLLDCRLSKDPDEMRRWTKRPEAVEELLATGWWEDGGDHYQIRHHAIYQRSAEQVLKLQERNQKNGKNGGRPAREKPPRKPSRKTEVETQVGVNGSKNGSDDGTSSKQGSAPKPQVETQMGTQVATQRATQRDRTGRVPYVSTSSRKEKNKNQPLEEKGHNEKSDEDYVADYRAWCEEEPSGSYTPTADQLRRIEANVRAGYET